VNDINISIKFLFVVSFIFLAFSFIIPGNNSIVDANSSINLQTISACKNRIDIPEDEMHWLFIPQNAEELHTEIQYAFLAGELISKGAVDASSCPAGGLGSGGFANACGLAKTKPLVNQFQNLYDEAILIAWRQSGVPPIMLKQLIRYESQFWPGTWGEEHFGLGHLTYYGAHTALTWMPSLYRNICLGGNCSGRVDSSEIALLLNSMDASCPSCPGKIDIAKAVQSISLLADVVYGHCEQTAKVINNATETPSIYVVDYSTIWKLTLMDYNVGPTCVYDSVREAYKKVKPLKVTWNDIETYTTDKRCWRGIYYANAITANFYTYP
jgi:hypothetical protein